MRVNNLLSNNPLFLVDVGASGGIHPRWPKLTSSYKAILFEPDPRELQILESKRNANLRVLGSALSDSEKTIDFYLCKKQQVSSVYLPNSDFIKKFPDPERYNVVDSIKIKADSLDNQLKKNSIKEIDFIKLDTQGSELSILCGGINTLRQVVGVEVEVEFVELYKTQPLFCQVDSFLTSLGFQLFDLRRVYWRRHEKDDNYSNKKGQLICGDALYFKLPEQILSIDEINQEKIIRAIFVYLAYGYPGLSEDLLNLSGKKILSNEIFDSIAPVISNSKKRRLKIPDFQGKGRVWKVAHKLADIFAPNNHWYCGTDDPSLSNP